LPRREAAADSQDVSWLTVAGKRALIGRPFPTYRATEQLLPKRIALPVFASDSLSSVAYATEEILLVLSLGGVAACPDAPWPVNPQREGVPCPTSFSCC
jgi:hypothetical protein